MTTVLTIFDLKKTMEEKSLVVVEQPQNVQTASVLIIEQFLNDNYRLRRNVLSGKVEFKAKAELTAAASLSKPFVKGWTSRVTPRPTLPCMSTQRRYGCTTLFWLS